MRFPGVVLLALGLALAASSVTAQEARTSFTLVAKNQGGAFLWADETTGGINPTLVVPPKAQITIVAKQGEGDGIPHNIKVGTNPVSDDFSEPDQSVTYRFAAPDTGTLQYLCAIHPATMKGTVRVQGTAPTEETPGLGVVGFALALAGAALLVRRRT